MDKKIIFLIMALCIQCHYSFVQAQDDNTPIVIELNTPDELKSTTSSPTTKKKSYLKKTDKNIIKTGLLSFIYGEIPFYYERYIKDFFTIEIGAGLTTRSFYADLDYIIQHGSTYYRATSSDYGVYNWVGENEYDEPENYHDYQYRKSSIGPYISITPKFYFGGDAPEGVYLAPHFSYSINYFKIPNVNEQGIWMQSAGIFKEHLTNKYVGLIFGGQIIFNKISLDMFASGGFNFIQAKRQDIGYYYNETNEIDYEYKYINRSLNYKKTRPYVRINFALGYAWAKKEKV